MNKQFAKNDVVRTEQPPQSYSPKNSSNPNGIGETESAYTMPKHLNDGVSIPKKFFDENGEMDLRKGTGPEVSRYLRAIGIDVVPMIRL